MKLTLGSLNQTPIPFRKVNFVHQLVLSIQLTLNCCSPLIDGIFLSTMDAILLRNLVEIQSGPSPDEATRPLTAPEKTYQRTYSSGPYQEEIVNVRPRSDTFASGVVTPRTEDADLERSRPASPVLEVDAVEVIPSVWEPYMNRFRLLSVCLANFGNALSDSAAGALIPYMEK